MNLSLRPPLCSVTRGENEQKKKDLRQSGGNRLPDAREKERKKLKNIKKKKIGEINKKESLKKKKIWVFHILNNKVDLKYKALA